YTTVDTSVLRDTIWLDVAGSSCYTRMPIPLAGHGLSPILVAEDLLIKGVDTGTTECRSLRVRNVGTADLLVGPGLIAAPFQFGSTQSVTIGPNGYHDFSLCFSPHE